MSTFSRLLFKRAATWTRPELYTCSTMQLSALAMLAGIATSGTKEQKIDRILDAIDLRLTLADVKTPEEMVEDYSKAELAALAKRAGTCHYINKRGIAAGLLNWRNECRRRGQQALAAARAQANVDDLLPLMAAIQRAQSQEATTMQPTDDTTEPTGEISHAAHAAASVDAFAASVDQADDQPIDPRILAAATAGYYEAIAAGQLAEEARNAAYHRAADTLGSGIYESLQAADAVYNQHQAAALAAYMEPFTEAAAPEAPALAEPANLPTATIPEALADLIDVRRAVLDTRAAYDTADKVLDQARRDRKAVYTTYHKQTSAAAKAARYGARRDETTAQQDSQAKHTAWTDAIRTWDHVSSRYPRTFVQLAYATTSENVTQKHSHERAAERDAETDQDYEAITYYYAQPTISEATIDQWTAERDAAAQALAIANSHGTPAAIAACERRLRIALEALQPTEATAPALAEPEQPTEAAAPEAPALAEARRKNHDRYSVYTPSATAYKIVARTAIGTEYYAAVQAHNSQPTERSRARLQHAIAAADQAAKEIDQHSRIVDRYLIHTQPDGLAVLYNEAGIKVETFTELVAALFAAEIRTLADAETLKHSAQLGHTIPAEDAITPHSWQWYAGCDYCARGLTHHRDQHTPHPATLCSWSDCSSAGPFERRNGCIVCTTCTRCNCPPSDPACAARWETYLQLAARQPASPATMGALQRFMIGCGRCTCPPAQPWHAGPDGPGPDQCPACQEEAQILILIEQTVAADLVNSTGEALEQLQVLADVDPDVLADAHAAHHSAIRAAFMAGCMISQQVAQAAGILVASDLDF